ncbi:hypothetical protein [Haloferax sp. YSSS75]|uniref:DUF7504 family protein n=1 Tax=Haloferax sp. YSSS75 TaxID=3388564 RepID=UPI00398C92FB
MDGRDEAESHVSSDSDEGDSSSLAGLAEKLAAATSATEQSHEESLTDDGSVSSESSRRTSLSDLADAVRGKRPERNGRPTGGQSPSTWESTGAETDSFDADVELAPGSAAVLDRVEDETNLLLVGPSDCSMTHVLCERLMEPDPSSTTHRQLVVSVDTPPEEQRDILRAIRRESVESQVLVDAQSYAPRNAVDDYDDAVTVRTVSTPRDLRRIGILTTKVLTEWTDVRRAGSVCFYTLSALLDAVDDVERVFRFVHILQGRVRASGARAHFYLDPTRHDEQTIRTFFSLFDTIVEYDAEGSLRIL